MKKTNCRLCKKPIKPFFSLGNMPLVNTFLKSAKTKENKFDLTVGFCPNCYLVQLMKEVSPKDLFQNYIYFSSTSKTIVTHNQTETLYLKKRLKLHSKSLVMEIASNDGAFLQFLQNMGVPVIGVDPARNIARIANKKGIKTIPDFFNYTFAKKYIKNKGKKPHLIYGANVLAHVPGIVDFVHGVKALLDEKGTAVFESPYLQGLLDNKFDTIYHEHVFYYSVIALQNLFNAVNLTIYDVDFVDMQGGSFRIFVCHPGAFPISKNVKRVIGLEKQKGYYKIGTYRKMNANIRKLKSKLIRLLTKLKKENKTVVGYSAPAKGNILLNYFQIGTNYLDFIVDKAKEKQGLYTPGTHLLVYPPDKIMDTMPDYVLILCWNIADEVVQQLDEYRKKGGTFIIPVPRLRVI